jgi:hypothetical protein
MIILIHPLYFIEIEGLPIASACRREWSEWEYRNRGEGICAWVVGRGVTGLCASAAGHWLIITPERCGSFAIHHLSPHMSHVNYFRPPFGQHQPIYASRSVWVLPGSAAEISRNRGLGHARHGSMMLQQRVLSRRPTGSEGEKTIKVRSRIEVWAGSFPACSRPPTIPYNCNTVN